MKELTCPQCGSIFTVDEADYASIVNQVKNAKNGADCYSKNGDAVTVPTWQS